MRGQLIEGGKHQVLCNKNNAEYGFKQLDVLRRCCDTRAILRFGYATYLCTAARASKGKEKQVPRAKNALGMTIFRFVGMSDGR
jgi:hypothetical protein